MLELAPQLLVAAGNVASALPPADLEANQPNLSRFELAVESLQLQARSLGPAAAVDDAVRRMEDAEQYLGEFVRGLRGGDTTVVAVRDGAAQADLAAIEELQEQARRAIADDRLDFRGADGR